MNAHRNKYRYGWKDSYCTDTDGDTSIDVGTSTGGSVRVVKGKSIRTGAGTSTRSRGINMHGKKTMKRDNIDRRT